MKAIWNGKVLAEGNNTFVLDGNQYFPPDFINWEYFKSNNTNRVCPLKGTALYYSIVIDGQENTDADWFYPNPSDKAKEIKDHVAFWKGVQVSE